MFNDWRDEDANLSDLDVTDTLTTLQILSVVGFFCKMAETKNDLGAYSFFQMQDYN